MLTTQLESQRQAAEERLATALTSNRALEQRVYDLQHELEQKEEKARRDFMEMQQSFERFQVYAVYCLVR